MIYKAIMFTVTCISVFLESVFMIFILACVVFYDVLSRGFCCTFVTVKRGGDNHCTQTMNTEGGGWV